jgi:hypothetical protein
MKFITPLTATRCLRGPGLNWRGDGLYLGLEWADTTDGRRPEDTLLGASAGVATGSGRRSLRVAMDVGVFNPQAQGHSQEAAAKSLRAASAYAACKRGHIWTEGKRRQALNNNCVCVFATVGGVDVEVDHVVESTETPIAVIALQFWQRLRVNFRRAHHLAFTRHVVIKRMRATTRTAALLENAGRLEDPWGM